MAENDSTPGTENIMPLHLEDAAGFFGDCVDAFSRLSALFGAIEHCEANGHRIPICELAALGRYVAFDFANMADGWREQAADTAAQEGGAA